MFKMAIISVAAAVVGIHSAGFLLVTKKTKLYLQSNS